MSVDEIDKNEEIVEEQKNKMLNAVKKPLIKEVSLNQVKLKN